jgi:hypothetical protein
MKNVVEFVLFVENILKEMKCMPTTKFHGVNDEKLKLKIAKCYVLDIIG